jgi:hypothetical protein
MKGLVDIVFLIDATGDMQPCIDAVKNSVRLFIDELTAGTNNQSIPLEKRWRAKVVGYRDFIHDTEPLVDNPFTDDVAVLESQLGALVADGGGDPPESLLEGIYHVANMGQTERGGAIESQQMALSQWWCQDGDDIYQCLLSRGDGRAQRRGFR